MYCLLQCDKWFIEKILRNKDNQHLDPLLYTLCSFSGWAWSLAIGIVQMEQLSQLSLQLTPSC